MVYLPYSMEIPEIEYLYNLRRFGMKMDLSVMKEFVKNLGNPQDGLNYAHITGTNGKGSVCSMLYSIMKRKYRCGLYTSPHIERFNERIVVDDREIEDSYIVNFVRDYRKTIEKLAGEKRNPTFFEVTTGMAFRYFRDKNIDFGIIEVGLGGRLDATNIINPDITAIVTVDKEHTKILGDKIEDIAREKAGIIKENVPVVVGERKREAVEIIKNIAERKGTEYHNVNDEFEVENFEMNLNGIEFKAKSPVREYRIKNALTGNYQVVNTLVAVRMAEILSENYNITGNDIERGIERNVWRDRFEVKMKEPLLIFDSSHNPAGMREMVNIIKRLRIQPVTFLFSMLSDKDLDSTLRILKEVSTRIILTEIDYKRKTPLSELENNARKYFLWIKGIKNSCDALKFAIENEERIVITGSIYLLGELEKCLRSL